MRTDVGGGMPRYAMQFDRGAQRYSVTLMLDKLQFSVWVAFFHHVIKKGSITFDMPLDSGFGTEMHAVNIVPGSYSATRTGGIATIVSFTVEAESTVYHISAADGAAIVDIYNAYGNQADPLLQRIGQFATVDSNVLDLV